MEEGIIYVDYKSDSDIDIMILVDLADMEIEEYRHQLSDFTYDINENYDVDIKPIAKSDLHFNKWQSVYKMVKKEIRHIDIKTLGNTGNF